MVAALGDGWAFGVPSPPRAPGRRRAENMASVPPPHGQRGRAFRGEGILPSHAPQGAVLHMPFRRSARLSARGRAECPPPEGPDSEPNHRSINMLRDLFHGREGRMPSLQRPVLFVRTGGRGPDDAQRAWGGACPVPYRVCRGAWERMGFGGKAFCLPSCRQARWPCAEKRLAALGKAECLPSGGPSFSCASEGAALPMRKGRGGGACPVAYRVCRGAWGWMGPWREGILPSLVPLGTLALFRKAPGGAREGRMPSLQRVSGLGRRLS